MIIYFCLNYLINDLPYLKSIEFSTFNLQFHYFKLVIKNPFKIQLLDEKHNYQTIQCYKYGKSQILCCNFFVYVNYMFVGSSYLSFSILLQNFRDSYFKYSIKYFFYLWPPQHQEKQLKTYWFITWQLKDTKDLKTLLKKTGDIFCLVKLFFKRNKGKFDLGWT